MRRYKVTATTVGIMVLVAALVGFGAVVLADQPKDSAANQPQPAFQLQNQVPEVEGCGTCYLRKHLDEFVPSQDLHPQRTFMVTISDSECGHLMGACFRQPPSECGWIITVENGKVESRCI